MSSGSGTSVFEGRLIAPLQNKAGALLTNPMLRNCLGQYHQRFDLETALDERWLIIIRLPKGELGEAEASLLGSVWTTAIYMAALKRSRIEDEDARPDTHLFVDEFQLVGSTVFSSILSEARKYHLSLVLSHQFMGQLSDEIKKAVLGNVGTSIAFRTSAEDWPILEREFSPLPERTLRELSPFEVVVRLDGGRPFTAETLPPLLLGYRKRQEVVKRSRIRFARPRTKVENDLGRWLSRDSGL